MGSDTDPRAAAAAAAPRAAGRPRAPPAAGALERPEVLVGAAFAGAFLLARILKRLVD